MPYKHSRWNVVHYLGNIAFAIDETLDLAEVFTEPSRSKKWVAYGQYQPLFRVLEASSHFYSSMDAWGDANKLHTPLEGILFYWHTTKMLLPRCADAVHWVLAWFPGTKKMRDWCAQYGTAQLFERSQTELTSYKASLQSAKQSFLEKLEALIIENKINTEIDRLTAYFENQTPVLDPCLNEIAQSIAEMTALKNAIASRLEGVTSGKLDIQLTPINSDKKGQDEIQKIWIDEPLKNIDMTSLEYRETLEHIQFIVQTRLKSFEMLTEMLSRVPPQEAAIKARQRKLEEGKPRELEDDSLEKYMLAKKELLLENLAAEKENRKALWKKANDEFRGPLKHFVQEKRKLENRRKILEVLEETKKRLLFWYLIVWVHQTATFFVLSKLLYAKVFQKFSDLFKNWHAKTRNDILMVLIKSASKLTLAANVISKLKRFVPPFWDIFTTPYSNYKKQPRYDSTRPISTGVRSLLLPVFTIGTFYDYLKYAKEFVLPGMIFLMPKRLQNWLEDVLHSSQQEGNPESSASIFNRFVQEQQKLFKATLKEQLPSVPKGSPLLSSPARLLSPPALVAFGGTRNLQKGGDIAANPLDNVLARLETVRTFFTLAWQGVTVKTASPLAIVESPLAVLYAEKQARTRHTCAQGLQEMADFSVHTLLNDKSTPSLELPSAGAPRNRTPSQQAATRL